MCNVRNIFHVICSILFVSQHICGLTIGNSTRIRRQANKACTGFSFKCKSGQCIEDDQECNGKVDCADGSDETNQCRRIRCPSHLFRCNYGACINPDLECNGKKDCQDNSDETSPRCRRSTPSASSNKCSAEEFQCASGKCIPEDNKCDGTAECDDHSDETAATCQSVKCPGFTYKCAYGACVNGNSKCNGIQECFDNSDEDPNECVAVTPGPTPVPPIVTKPAPLPDPVAPEGSCVLPQHPDRGKWEIFGDFKGYRPGTSVNSGTVLRISCNNKYKLDGNSVVQCFQGKWSSGIGICLALCPSMENSSTMRVTCTFNERDTDCKDVLSGTLARFKCTEFYEDLELNKNPIRICQDGTWDQAKPNCKPVCGVKSVSATTLVVDGKKVNRGDYPWQVALYRHNNADKTQTLICGGSLINQRVAITAAHCITDSKGGLYSMENYSVAVGKYFRAFNDSRETEPQFSTLTAMYVPEQYKGDIQNYLGDIAVVVTKKTFFLSKTVQPVCIDWGLIYEVQFSDPSIMGYVAGWGNTIESGNISDVLRELKVPPIDYDRCNADLPEDYEKFLTFDKLCAGFLNTNKSVCLGDSGGGLVFKNRFDGRYYLTGIVSLSPLAHSADGGCNSQQYGLYTKVSRYITNFILGKSRLFKID